MKVIPDVLGDLRPTIDVQVAAKGTYSQFLNSGKKRTTAEPGAFLYPRQVFFLSFFLLLYILTLCYRQWNLPLFPLKSSMRIHDFIRCYSLTLVSAFLTEETTSFF
jgi:hypothetical protein